MNRTQRFILLSVFIFGSILIVFGTLTGEPVYYTVGSYAMLAVTTYSFLRVRSSKTLLLLVIAIDLLLRYVPIMKFNQPLYVDPVNELATAKEFENLGVISPLPFSSTGWVVDISVYSGWPMIHSLSLAISKITGISLFTVFTYFPPIVDLSSLLFVYLLTRRILGNNRIGAFSALIYATFYDNMFWTGTQMIRQNIAFALALMGVYLYVRGRSAGENKTAALALFTFAILPIAHHLTGMEIFYIFIFIFVLELFLNFSGRLRQRIFHSIPSRTPASNPLTITVCLFVGVSLFLWWSTYARDIIFRIFMERAYTVLLDIGELRFAGELPATAAVSGGFFPTNLGIYNVLSYARILFLALATIYGIRLLSKEKNRHRVFLYGFFLGPLLVFLIGYLVDRTFDVRHLLFMLIPTFIFTAAAMQKLVKSARARSRVILILSLLIIVIPGSFQLFAQPGDPTPTFVYDKSSTQPLLLVRGVYFREDSVLASTSFIASHTNDTLIADSYSAGGLLLYYDPYKILPPLSFYELLSDPQSISGKKAVILINEPFINNKFFAGLERGLYAKLNITTPIEELENYSNTFNSLTTRVYDNGYVRGWRNPP